MKHWITGALCAVLMTAAPVVAEEVLTIGVRSESSSLDPHWTQLSADVQVHEHIFEKLVALDSASQPIPGLAVSWQPLDDTTWEFKLREGVKWHDGEDFTADDVIFTFDRLKAGISGAPASPAFQLDKGGKQWTKIDDLTIHITTDGPLSDRGRGPGHAADRGRTRGQGRHGIGGFQQRQGHHRHRPVQI